MPPSNSPNICRSVLEGRMISNKIVLTYKRKHASSQSDPTHNAENASSKSPRRVPTSATFNEPLERDDKPTTQGRWQHAACVKQHDNAGESVQQQVQDSDRFEKCESAGGFERGLTELHPQNSSLLNEVFQNDAAISKNSNFASVDSKSTLANGTTRNKKSSGTNPISFDSTEKKHPSLCKEESTSKTFISGEKGLLPLEENPKILSQRTVHKESFGTPLRTFCRRAKKIKDATETEVYGNSRIVKGLDSTCEKNTMLDPICESGGQPDQSKEVPVFGKDGLDSSRSSLNLNAKDMGKDLQDDPNHEPNSGSLVENKKDRSEGSAIPCTGTSNFTIKQTEVKELVLEDRSDKFRSNFSSNDPLNESSSEVSQKNKPFMRPKTCPLIRDMQAVDLVDAVQKPIVRSISNERLKAGISLSSPRPSDRPHSNISVHELTSNKNTAGSLCDTRKSMSDASHKNLFDSEGSSNRTVEEVNRTRKGLEPSEATEKRKGGVLCTSMTDIDINCRLAFCENDNLCQMSMNSSLPDPTVPQMQDFLRETTNQTASSQKGNFVRGIGESILVNEWGTQATRTSCTDFLSSISTRPEYTVDPIRNFQGIAPTSSLRGTSYNHEVQLPWKASESNSSIFRHKQVVDDIITSSRMLNKRHDYYLANYRRFSSVWSEEELDCLWIGVRRHGKGNWHAMLEDPKLRFAGWRIAEDLAERWDMEQSRLLNVPFVQPVRSLEPDRSPVSLLSNGLLPSLAVDISHSDYLSEVQNYRNESGLSLGGIYLKKEGKSTNRNPAHLLDFPVHPLTANGNLGTSSSYSYRGHQRHPPSTNAGMTHQRLGKAQKNIYDLGPSILEQNSVERSPGIGHQVAAPSASPNLPHWLKEVLGCPTTPSEPMLLSTVSTIEHSVVSHSCDQVFVPSSSYPGDQLAPLKDAQRGILKRRGTSSKSVCILASSTLKCTGETNPDANILDLNQCSAEAIKHNNLVILDSDASSEETISDDQSGRH